jgi:hypothetical protein
MAGPDQGGGQADKISVAVLTGYLGAGKTTFGDLQPFCQLRSLALLTSRIFSSGCSRLVGPIGICLRLVPPCSRCERKRE